MPAPLFSILLPTKNRSEIVGGAIQSVLDQDVADWELIVSDNDDSPTATREAVARFPDPRIRYVRTSGTLAMHENWDNAFREARGRHTLILEDKMRLVPHALHVLAGHLARGAAAVSFPIHFTPDATYAGTADDRALQLESQEVMDRFARFDATFFDVFPKGLDCCASRELLEDIRRASPTGFLFSYICPDYAFGFQLLSRLDRYTHVEAPLVYVPNNWGWSSAYSNGQASYQKNEKIERFLNQLPIPRSDITARVPIQVEYLWLNMVLHDFFKLYRRADHQPKVNWRQYHATVGLLILLGRRTGADMGPEWRALRTSLRRAGVFFTVGALLAFLGQLTRQTIRLTLKRLHARRP